MGALHILIGSSLCSSCCKGKSEEKKTNASENVESSGKKMKEDIDGKDDQIEVQEMQREEMNE